jgi:hypothetical protein
MSARVGNAMAQQATTNITTQVMTLDHNGLFSSVRIMEPKKEMVPCTININGARTTLMVAGTMGCLRNFIDYFDHEI